jgi:hypothetical protein
MSLSFHHINLFCVGFLVSFRVSLYLLFSLFVHSTLLLLEVLQSLLTALGVLLTLKILQPRVGLPVDLGAGLVAVVVGAMGVGDDALDIRGRALDVLVAVVHVEGLTAGDGARDIRDGVVNVVGQGGKVAHAGGVLTAACGGSVGDGTLDGADVGLDLLDGGEAGVLVVEHIDAVLDGTLDIGGGLLGSGLEVVNGGVALLGEGRSGGGGGDEGQDQGNGAEGAHCFFAV